MVSDLPTMLRFYIYGLHGYLAEITFTAIWDFVVEGTGDWKLKGCSSIWSFFIYGTCGLFLQKVSKSMRQRSAPFWLRGVVFGLIAYTWEFCWGVFLTLLNACPWDYSDFTYNLYGLITLEYAPFWMAGGLFMERLLFT